MAPENHEGVPSKAAIKGHPIHPMLVLFPVAFLVGTVLTDFAFWSTKDFFWARASFWLVAAGLFTGVLAALAGLVDFFSIAKVRNHRAGIIHFAGNAAVLVIAFANWWIRLGDPAENIVPAGLLLSLVIALTLVVTGWYGGELVYRHRIGVTGHQS